MSANNVLIAHLQERERNQISPVQNKNGTGSTNSTEGGYTLGSGVLPVPQFTIIGNSGEYNGESTVEVSSVSDVSGNYEGERMPPLTPVNRSGGSETEHERNLRKLKLVKVYGEGGTLPKNDGTLRTLTRAVRKVILPQMKFVQSGKGFGSFDQPDFTHKNCWANRLFESMPMIHRGTDEQKAMVWMTYRHKIKEQFSLHRSGVSYKIKQNFIKGKCIVSDRFMCCVETLMTNMNFSHNSMNRCKEIFKQGN